MGKAYHKTDYTINTCIDAQLETKVGWVDTEAEHGRVTV
jgi:hypothetical protein